MPPRQQDSQISSASRRRVHRSPWPGSDSDSISSAHGQDHERHRHQVFTAQEDYAIRRCVRKKLLAEDGAALSDMQKCLRKADAEHSGSLGQRAFEQTLLTKGPASCLTRDEVRWLCCQLQCRNGSIPYRKIRKVLEDPSAARGRQENIWSPSDRRRPPRNSSDSSSRSNDGLDGMTKGQTVGAWLRDVASPMERKLFHDFVKLLERFEYRNGLDHYRFAELRQGGDGAMIIHLGGSLKAAIKFIV